MDEEVTIPLACDTKRQICATESGHRRVRHPPRKKSESLDETEHNRFRIDNSLLNQHDPVVSNVPLEIYVRAGDHQVVRLVFPPVVDAKAMIPQICSAAIHRLVTRDREFDQPEFSKHLFKAMAVER